MQATTRPVGRFQQEVNLLPRTCHGLCFTALFIPGLAEKIIPAPVARIRCCLRGALLEALPAAASQT